MALRHRIAPLMRDIRRLRPCAVDILGHFHFPPGTHPIEGINHTIGFTKHRLRGIRDGACFFLKICAVFFGTWRGTKKRARRSGPFDVAASCAYLNS
jgi:hypothetical protein